LGLDTAKYSDSERGILPKLNFEIYLRVVGADGARREGLLRRRGRGPTVGVGLQLRLLLERGLLVGVH